MQTQSGVSKPATPWYHQPWGALLLLVVVPPLGVAALWASPATKRIGRIAWTGALTVVYLLVLISGAWFVSGRTTQPGPKTDAVAPQMQLAPSAAPSLPTGIPAPNAATVKTLASAVPYDDLTRSPSDYLGRVVTLTGEVSQIVEYTGGHISMLVNVTQDEYGYWKDPVWVEAPDSPRVLEDDVIQLWGAVAGERQYTTLLGTNRSPLIEVSLVELKHAR